MVFLCSGVLLNLKIMINSKNMNLLRFFSNSMRNIVFQNFAWVAHLCCLISEPCVAVVPALHFNTTSNMFLHQRHHSYTENRLEGEQLIRVRSSPSLDKQRCLKLQSRHFKVTHSNQNQDSVADFQMLIKYYSIGWFWLRFNARLTDILVL